MNNFNKVITLRNETFNENIITNLNSKFIIKSLSCRKSNIIVLNLIIYDLMDTK